MFNVTKSAQAEIASYFKENELQPIRVFLFESGCGGPQIAMGLDKKRGNDAIYDFSGVQYVIDKEFLEKAGPVEIDYQATMKSKITAVLTIIMICFAVVPCLWGEEKSGGAQSDPLLPVAFVPDPNYEFGSVLDGVAVLHEFIIKNTGGAALLIKKVRTSCGCTTASYTKEIPAGGEGKVAIKGNTSGYGGRKFSKTITVSTNDPKNKNLILRIHPQAKNVYDIDSMHLISLVRKMRDVS